MPRIPKMKAEERREMILESALKVFSEKGYHLTTTKELAAVAGISEPLIYKYFKGKKDLYLSLLGELKETLLQGWKDAEEGFDKPEDILRAFGMGFYMVVIESPETAKVVFQTFTEVGMEEVLDYSRDLQLELHTITKGVIEEGLRRGDFSEEVDPDLAAWRFMAIGFTISVMSVLGLKEQFGPEKAMNWGDLLIESLQRRD